MRVSPSRLDGRCHYKLGQCLLEAASNIGRRTVIIASGNLSRRPDNKSQNEAHNIQDAMAYDKEILNIFASGAFNRLLSVPISLRERADECGHAVFTMLAGCMDRRQVRPEVLSYENAFGEGYTVASFTPGPYEESRNFLEQTEHTQRRLVLKSRASEDAFCVLARRALEYSVLHGHTLPIPVGLPQEMLNTRAGAFVSIYVNGRLRGAAGALGPSTDHVAAEIVKYAVAAGQADKRFTPVTEDELQELVYKVDVIGNPELISGPEQLDVSRYGLIISSSDAWGVMLPNQHGIETPEQQIAAVMQKAGIADDTHIRMERFLVDRHE
ncbi:MAG: AMMECR1 domain-containing protein, partial [Defluviitaleaceae bacterium]|nr:AMMECR1 domain-containing protein [Defluviitaleaceae bacterium]